MIRIIGFLAAFLALNAPQAMADNITIGIVGDQTGSYDLDKSYQVLQQGVQALQGQNLDVVLHVGDLVESTKSDQEITARFQQGVTLLNQIRVPWYMTAGDHDVNPPTFLQNSTDRSKETLFKQLYGAVNPLAQNNLYYSFDVKNYHIVVLYSLEHLDTDPRWGNIYYSKLSDAQMQWLEADLAANTPGKNGTIVLLHQPMWYNWTGWASVHQLLAKYGVNSVLAGHFHYNQSQIVQDGITYQVVGATGGTTKQGSANAGDLHHVTIMTMSPNSAPDFNMIPLSPFVQTNWTKKPIMDRIQALDTDMGNIFNFSGDSPVFVKNGALLKSCSSNDPAQLVLDGIGNAAAIPVNVAINVVADNVNVSTASFGTGFCQTDIDEYQCQMAPSAGVAVSNNSLIQASAYPVPPPLWTATLAAGSTPPNAGDVITLTINQSFNDNNQNYLVEKIGTVTIQACN